MGLDFTAIRCNRGERWHAPIPDQVQPGKGAATNLPTVPQVMRNRPFPNDPAVLPLGVGAHHLVAQHPGLDSMPTHLSREIEFGHLIESGDWPEPAVPLRHGLFVEPPEALLNCLSAQP